jgi:hypothetical protein
MAMETVIRTIVQVNARIPAAKRRPGTGMPKTRADATRVMTDAPTIPQIKPLERCSSRAYDISTSSPTPEAHFDLPLYDLLDGISDPAAALVSR